VADQLGPADEALTERYEQLRQTVQGGSGHADGWRHGLGVLTGRGMAAWMRVSPDRTAPATPPATDPSRTGPARDTLAGQVVAVLSQMALAHA
jgi:hypothetical protein